MQVVKNIDKDLFHNSAKAKVCPLCSRKFANMVLHFKTTHKEYEVFVPRISQRMCDSMKTPKFTKPIKYMKLNVQYMRATCGIFAVILVNI